MRILILDPQANALDWALRCLKDGHQVRWYVPDKPRVAPIGEGLVQKVKEWSGWLRWADLVFCTDNTAYLDHLDHLRRRGGAPPIIGATAETADWELDRAKGMSMFRNKGIAVAPSREFTDYDAAIRYVKQQDKPFVSKPSGDADKALSYVAKTPEDLVFMLERWKSLGKLKAPFILQERIYGTEMAVGGWVGPHGFNEGWCENFEFKKLLNGDLGPNTGEQGTILRYVKHSRLAKKVLAPFAADLVRAGYIGYVDVNCIVDDKGTPWPLEFTMRPGWPTFNIQQVLHTGDHAGWLMDLAMGKDARAVRLNEIAAGVVLSMPDYPFNKLPVEQTTGIPIYGMTPSTSPWVHPCEMALGAAPQRVGEKIETAPIMVSAGTYLLVASGTGETVEEASRHAYQTLRRLSLPNSPMYRSDIGRRLQWQLPKLQSCNYATGMTYAATPSPSKPS